MSAVITNEFEKLPYKLKVRIRIDSDGHWIWTGALHGSGYGQIELAGPNGQRNHHMAGRLVSELLGYPLGENMHHKYHEFGCPKLCVNPEHLAPVSIAEHASTHGMCADYAKRDRCKNDHLYTEENTYMRPDGKGRMCRKCNLARYYKAKARRDSE